MKAWKNLNMWMLSQIMFVLYMSRNKVLHHPTPPSGYLWVDLFLPVQSEAKNYVSKALDFARSLQTDRILWNFLLKLESRWNSGAFPLQYDVNVLLVQKVTEKSSRSVADMIFFQVLLLQKGKEMTILGRGKQAQLLLGESGDFYLFPLKKC